MPTTEANGQTLYYEVHGDGEPLLCAMGLAADVLAWALQLPAFSASHRTIVFDNRDVGRSSQASEPYEIADVARDALALADALELERFHLLGVSMGGAIAQEVAVQAPERLRTLTLGLTYAAGGAWGRSLSKVWGARVKAISHEQHVDELMLMNLSEEFYENPEAVAFARGLLLQNPYPQSPDAFARQLDASSRHDARAELASLSMPVHVIGSERDILIPVWKSRELAELIPGAKLTILEGAPHAATFERAEEFNGAVLGFIREAAPAAAG